MPARALGQNNAAVLTELGESFRQRYGVAPQVFQAPGRVNLIGEHTDYNNGFVMPVALQFSSYAAIGAKEGRSVVVYSRNWDEWAEFSLDENVARPKGHWSDYVRGVAGVLQEEGICLRSAHLMISGNVPIGSGLSSSASLEVACALAFLSAAGATLDRITVAKICQRAEHKYVGTRCGIMDQFVACFGEQNRALLLDCGSLTFESLRLDPAFRIVICNTRVRHELAASEYNRRRLDCEEGVRSLAAKLATPVHSLRDVSLNDLESCRKELPEVIYRRCRHVITENMRVQEAAVALQSGDVPKFGALMYESHRSLRDDYEVSCPELDLMVELASDLPGVYGARMTGGGFGGCTVNFVHGDAADEFKAAIEREYERRRGLEADVYVCAAAAGAGPCF